MHTGIHLLCLLAGLIEIFSLANLQPARPNLARLNPFIKPAIYLYTGALISQVAQSLKFLDII